MTIRVLVADDHTIVRNGLRALLDKAEGVDCVGEADNGREAVRLTGELAPDVVILDVAMPDLNGIEAARLILGEQGSKVIALSMQSDRRYVVEMLKAGASGYLLKDCAFEELARAVETVADGRTYLSADVAGLVVEDYLSQLAREDPEGASLLTSREREVLQLLAEGRSTKDIAKELHLSVKTIETHRQQIMRKLEIRSVAELTKFAIREGLTSLDS